MRIFNDDNDHEHGSVYGVVGTCSYQWREESPVLRLTLCLCLIWREGAKLEKARRLRRL